MWKDTAVSRLLGIRYPIIQGPFGGGLSSPALAAAVSNCGGLGSFGFQGMGPEKILDTIKDIRSRTASPFAANLWISTEDAETAAESSYNAALEPLLEFYAELGLTPPAQQPRRWPKFADQIAAVLDARPPVFSFLFGIPPAEIFTECRKRRIVTIGTATTADEAVALEQAGVDLVVATGSDAGGHRASFLRSAEASLTGTFSLIPQTVDAVKVPVIAAGGIADGRGIAAAFALGAAGVQIGTAFLACAESNAVEGHRRALFSPEAKYTVLSRAFTGRLARGLRNRLLTTLESKNAPLLPYPLQNDLVSGLRIAAINRGCLDLVSFWAGQAAPLLRRKNAAQLFECLIQETEQNLNRIAQHVTKN